MGISGLKRIATGMALATASMALSQSGSRTLDVPPAAGWKHAETGLILPAVIAGMHHGAIQDSGTQELDVMAAYSSLDGSVQTTIFLFRPAVMSVPVWFDRSRTQVELNPLFKIPADLKPAIASFTPPGATQESGLRTVWALPSGEFKSTGLAMVPMGDWLVAVRMTSTSLDASDLERQMEATLASIGWPKDVPAAPAAAPVEPCSNALEFRHAKVIRPDMAQVLLGSVLNAAARKKDSAPATYCRESPPTAEMGVYRRVGTSDSYLVALGDAGRAIRVAPPVDLLKPAKGYSVTFLDLDGTAIYPSFDRLPEPAQAVALVANGKPISETPLSGKGEKTTVNINAGPAEE